VCLSCRPCHHIPGGKASPKTISTTDDNHGRIETAFQKYFYRADFNASAIKDETQTNDPSHHHEVEIIVCHANVIRYFLCRALQLPPEAWLRFCPFNCSITYFTIRPTGTVSCRMVGDIGHLPYETSTFSMHEGYLW
jgi:serine/threonine-protein phosphatase PGAM5